MITGQALRAIRIVLGKIPALDKRHSLHDNVEVTRKRRDNQLTVRIPQQLRDAIDVQAERERRTVADVVNNVMEAHYAVLAAARERGRRR